MSNWKSLFIVFLSFYISEGWCFFVELRGPRYVPLGGSATLKCDYNVAQESLHKVEWFKGSHKIFQYVNGRRPPFRNYSTPGSHLDWIHSNERQVMLKEMDIEASGLYSCEVSTDTPIYTKESQDLEITVVQVQLEEPRIWFGKPRYQEGEWLQVNCTTGPAKPPPHVTWLINGKQVEDWRVKSYQGKGGVRTAQLGLEIGSEHVGELRLTCLSTIPAFMGHHARHSEYADKKENTIAIEVMGKPRSPPRPEVRPSSSLGPGGGGSSSSSSSGGSKCRTVSVSSLSSPSLTPALWGPATTLTTLLLFTDIR